jgi:hypothetical protein
MYLHEKSKPVSSSEVDLFSIPGTKTDIEQSLFVCYQPVNTLSDHSPIEFHINQSGTDYLDLSRSYLYVKLRIVSPTGAVFADAKNVGFINLPLHSLWSQVDLSLNDVPVSASNNLYAYRAYLETILNQDSGAKLSHLTSEGFIKDTAGHFNAVALTGPAAVNDGYIKRAKLTEASKSLELCGKLHLDMFNQPRFLLSNIDVKLKLTRSKENFVLLGTEDAKIAIDEISFFCRKVKLNDAVIAAHEQMLLSQKANYILNKTDLKYFVIPAGITSVNKENIIQGNLPKKMYLTFVNTNSFQGDKTLNPFDFNHFNISNISLFVEGNAIPQKPYNLNFADGQCVLPFYNLNETLDLVETRHSNGINTSQYAKGNTVFGFDLSNYQIDDGAFELIKKGSLRIEIQFSQALASSIVCICYLQSDGILEVNSQREIFTE